MRPLAPMPRRALRDTDAAHAILSDMILHHCLLAAAIMATRKGVCMTLLFERGPSHRAMLRNLFAGQMPSFLALAIWQHVRIKYLQYYFY